MQYSDSRLKEDKALRHPVHLRLHYLGWTIIVKSLSSSIYLDYHCFWAPLAIAQAARFQQWAVVLSSTGCVLAVNAVPNIQNYVFNWAIYAGGDLNWGGMYSWQVGYVDPYWAKVLIAVLAVDLVCILGVIILVHRRQSGLQQDPKGIITWVKLSQDICDESAIGLKSGDAFATSREIHSKLKDQRFIVSTDTAKMLLMLTENPKPSQARVPIRLWKVFLQPLPNVLARLWKVLPKSLRNVLGKIQGVCKRFAKFALNIYEKFQSVTKYASNMFGSFLLIPWIAWLIVSLYANTYIVAKMTTSEQLTLRNYALPWSPNIYLVVGVLIQVCIAHS